MLPLKTANGKPGTGNSDQVNSGVSSVPWLCPGARRSFFCRMKIKPASLIYKEDVDQVCAVLEKCLYTIASEWSKTTLKVNTGGVGEERVDQRTYL